MERLKGPDDMYGDGPDTPGGRPDTACTADLEVKQIQEGVTTPAPSLALTDGDYGFQAPDTNRSTLLRFINNDILVPLAIYFVAV